MFDPVLYRRFRDITLDLCFLTYSYFAKSLKQEEKDEFDEFARYIHNLFIEYIFIDYHEKDERKVTEPLLTDFDKPLKEKPSLDLIIKQMNLAELKVKELIDKFKDKFDDMEIEELDTDTYSTCLDFAPVCKLIKPRENIFDCCWFCPIGEYYKETSMFLGNCISSIVSYKFEHIYDDFMERPINKIEDSLHIYEKRNRHIKLVEYICHIKDLLENSSDNKDKP